MSNDPGPSNSGAGSGDGTRPTTSGGTDNIGAGEKVSQNTTKAGELTKGPAPKEAMVANRKTAQASTEDDSDAFGLHGDLTPSRNPEPTRPKP